MKKNKRILPERGEVNFVLMYGGMGDVVSSLPAIRYAHEKHGVKCVVFGPDFMKDFIKRHLPYASVYGISEMLTNVNKANPSKFMNSIVHTSMRTHTTYTAFHLLLDEHPEGDPNVFNAVTPIDYECIYKFRLPSKYITLGPCNAGKERPFSYKSIKLITEKSIYPVVLLGSTSHTHNKMLNSAAEVDERVFDLPNTINLVNQTSLLETQSIIHHSKVYVGMDGGLVHVAGTTKAPIIAGFNTVDPMHRLPFRNGSRLTGCIPITPPNLSCVGCQSTSNFIYEHKYNTCFFDDFKCLDLLKPKLWVNALWQLGLTK